MQRIALTMASLIMAPTMAFALPVTPLPGSADLEERPVGRQLLIESVAASDCARSRDGGCVDLEMRIWSDRFGPLEDRAQKFQAQREALMASKGYLLSDEGPIIERLVEDAPIETPLPAAIFPMMLGLAGAALAMRLKKPASR